MTTATDDFNRANAASLGTGWADIENDGMQVSSNTAIGPATTVWQTSRRTETFANDQAAEATITGFGPSKFAALILRASGSLDASTHYKIVLGGSSPGITDRAYFEKYIAGVYSAITDKAVAISNGSVVRAEMVGNVLTLYDDTVVAETFTDPGSSIASGSPGIAVYSDGEAGLSFDNFTATDELGGGGSTVTKTPTTANLSIGGRTISTNAFTAIRIRDVLINESGQPVGNAANITLKVWYSGYCSGPADFSRNGQTTDANGTASWSISTGTLTSGSPIFYVAQDSVSYSNYTAARMIPSYE